MASATIVLQSPLKRGIRNATVGDRLMSDKSEMKPGGKSEGRSEGKPERKSEQVAVNRRVKFEYEILERFEAGLVLTGSEVKSLRDHKVSLSDSYGRFEGGELYLLNLDIAAYEKAGYAQHEPKRKRKLLMRRSEMKRLMGKVVERGFTLGPMGIHFNSRGWAKVSLGLARGRQLYDKRRKIREREQDRDIARQMRRRG
jgi:SsrA-binding protein